MQEFIKDNLRVFVVPVDIMDVPELDIYEQMVYIVLRSFANAREATAFPSYATIARLGRMSRRKAIYVIESLIEKGLLRKDIRLDVTKNRKIRNTSNLYTIENPKTVSNIQECTTCTTPVHDMHHPSAQGAPKQNHLTKPFKNNGRMGGDATKIHNNENISFNNTYINEKDINEKEAEQEFAMFLHWCHEDYNIARDFFRVWKNHYARCPLPTAIAMLRDVIDDQYNLSGIKKTEYKSIVGVYHHRMKEWRSMQAMYKLDPMYEQYGGHEL